MGVGTNVRAGRSTRALVALQAAKGTAQAALGGALACALRTPRSEWDAGYEQDDPAWHSDGDAGLAEAAYTVPRARRGELVTHATPTSLEWLLRSHWGGFSGGAFTRAVQPNEWATLAFAENRYATSPGNLVRLYDAWFHHLRLEVDPAGRAALRAEYAAEASDVRALNALAGVTLPAAPMEPVDQNEMPGRSATLTRDPDGEAEAVPFSNFVLDFDAGLRQNWFQSDGKVCVYSSGHHRVRVTLSGRVNDETWVALTASRAGTREAWRFTLAAPSPAKTFTVDLHSVGWSPRPLVVRGTEYEAFVASGTALLDDAGDFVDLTLA